MQSPGHRANILRAGWRKTGVGAVTALGPSGVYKRTARATIVAAEFGHRS